MKLRLNRESTTRDAVRQTLHTVLLNEPRTLTWEAVAQIAESLLGYKDMILQGEWTLDRLVWDGMAGGKRRLRVEWNPNVSLKVGYANGGNTLEVVLECGGFRINTLSQEDVIALADVLRYLNTRLIKAPKKGDGGELRVVGRERTDFLEV